MTNMQVLEGTREPRRNATHGMSKSKMYQVWASIKSRCYDPKSPSFEDYGKRGITMHSSWKASFEEFLFYVAQLPHFDTDGYTIDRINNDGNYEPGNVRWATKFEQARNKSVNRLLTFNGKTQCIAQWAEELNTDDHVLVMRLSRNWDVERVLTTPVIPRGPKSTKKESSNRRTRRLLTFRGKAQNLAAWARELGMVRLTIHDRLKRGWTVEEALGTPASLNNKRRPSKERSHKS